MQNDISLASYIDHTLLKPDARMAQIEQLCSEAKQFKFFSVCVNSVYVEACARLLKDSGVKVCAVVGFPLGAMETVSKAFETERAVKLGATEVDMVLAIGALKDGRHDEVRKDIAAVVKAAAPHKVKVIFETSMLTNEEKIAACRLSDEAGAAFVKTSTGFGGGGATVEDVQLMKKNISARMEVKASGGIKDKAQAMAMIQAGATRLGTSSGIALVQGQTASGGY